jgi:hypothetical protein
MNIVRVGYRESEVVFGNTLCSEEIAGDYRKLPDSSSASATWKNFRH